METGSGCHRQTRTSTPGIAPDSLRGTVSVTGTGFEQQLVFRSDNGEATILSAAAADSAALTRLGGVEMFVIGTTQDTRFRVSRFRALSVAGASVVDGIVRDEGGRLMIETTDGRVPLGNPPVALRRLVGARVWVGGSMATGPNTYGIIAPAR